MTAKSTALNVGADNLCGTSSEKYETAVTIIGLVVQDWWSRRFAQMEQMHNAANEYGQLQVTYVTH
jgi:hypothetical protein